MLFQEKPNIVLFLRAKSLDFFFADKRQGVTLPFPAEAVSHQEVIDQTALKETVTKFLTEQQIKPAAAILVLSQEILYQKALPLLASGEEELQSKEFLEKVPFDPNVLTLKRIRTKTELYFVATNKVFYLAFVSLFESLGWKILSVMPSVNQDHINDNYVLDPENVIALLRNYRSASFANFMLENNAPQLSLSDQNNVVQDQAAPSPPSTIQPQTTPEPVSEPPRSRRKMIFIGLGVLLILIWFGGGLWFFRAKIPFLKKAPKKPTVVTSPVPSASPQVSPQATQSATPSAQAKDALTIQVLNGSGISGLANKVKAKLETLGYANITTGNAEKEASGSSVAFSKKTSDDIRQEIRQTLASDFSLKLATESSTVKSFDIEIIIGK